MAQGPLSSLLRHLRRTLSAPCAGISDAQLLERFLAGRDEAAFELLVRRHERMVLGVCRRVLRHTQDAEDAFQATFLTLACKASSIGKREALASWLYKVAFRIALRAKAQAGKRARRELPLAEGPGNCSSPESISQTDWQEVRDVLDDEVHRLPAKYRAPVILCYLEGKTNEEAALQLGCPTGTVVTHLARARRRLRDRLARRGLGISTALLTTALAPSSASQAVPAALVDATLQAAILFATNRAAAAKLVSANVALLTKGALRAMLMTKLKIVAAVLLTLGVLGAGSGAWTYHSLAIQGVEGALNLPHRLEPEQFAQARPEDTKKAAPGKPAAKQDRGHQTTKEVVTKSFKTGRTPRLVVDLFNGGIDLVADADGAIQIRVTKQGQGETQEAAEAALKNVDVQMAQEGDTVRVTAKRSEEDKKTNSGASAELRVPPGAVLELHTNNGPVSLEGGTGNIDAQTSNGKIHVKEHRGAAHLRTSNGPITFLGGTGQLDLKTSNGGIEIQGEKAVVTATTSNGSIQFQGTLAGGEHAFHTSNGNVRLALPADARFRFEAMTSHGRITNGFSKEQPRTRGRTQLAGTIGQNPSTTIKLHTSNGNIVLQPSKADE